MAMMEIRNVHKTFRTYAKAGLRPGAHKVVSELPVLQGVDLTVEKGDVVAILGPSGSGKTTLLRCLNFLETADAGQLVLDGETFDLAHAGRADIARLRKKTAFVFQNYNLFRNKTALQNVTEGLIVARRMPREQADAIGRRMLEKVGLADRADYYPRQLSGGQQQRVAIARALVSKPAIVLADEPTGNLDTKTTIEVMAMMVRMCRRNNQTLILVTHDSYLAQYADRIVTLIDGKIVSDVENKSIVDRMSNEEIVEYFLSENANLAETTVLESEEEIEAIRQELQEENQAEGEEPAPKAELPEQESPADTAEENLEGNKQ